MRSNLDRFDNYRRITAKFNSTTSCGHEVKKGDEIGYNSALKKTVCTACWYNWVAENRQAQAYEDTGSDCAYDY
jgi:hypothetical protein